MSISRGTAMPLGGWKARENFANRLRYLRETQGRAAAIAEREETYRRMDAHGYVGKGWFWRDGACPRDRKKGFMPTPGFGATPRKVRG